MIIEQLYTGCLAQGAYYIESEGESAIVDPLRETGPYLQQAKKRGSRIKYIFETHFHADFVSGHIDLAKRTGAQIVFGPTAKTSYDIIEATDGQEFKLGKIKIKVLHTPGHTPESSTFLVIDENDKPHAIFSGDTLFIGDVGRPDLAVKSDLTKEDLAGMLFESLRNKIMPLPDSVIVYPAHGAGSACGKNMSNETTDTLGHQKATNYALAANLSKEDFIREVTTGIMPPPQYFPKNAMINKSGYESFDEVMNRGLVALDADIFEQLANEHQALVLDTRTPQNFSAGHIPNSIFIGIDGQFAVWVGTLIPDLQQPILIVADPGREDEVVKRLARVGYDNAIGYLKGGIETWKKAGKEFTSLQDLSAQEFGQIYAHDRINVLDVRKPSEYAIGHLSRAQLFPLDFINDQIHDLDKNQKYYLHCAGGYRSMIAASILSARGFNDLVNVEGGYNDIRQAGIHASEFVKTDEPVQS